MLNSDRSSPATRTDDKLCSLSELLRRREIARGQGRRVVHCHGCFDLVHPGHIRHLRFAKAQGDILLVTLTGDEKIRKGTARPLIPQELRAENLAALDCVDWVAIDDRATAAELLAEVRPDVYVKGREYESNNDPRFKEERRTVERHGGRVVFSSGDVGFSSTALIDAIAGGTDDGLVDPRHRAIRGLTERPDLSAGNLSEVIAAWRGSRVLIVGEVIRDTYIFCERPDAAGEAPVLTLRPVERRTFDGGAAALARHATALGAAPTLVTALPETPDAEALRMNLLASGVDVRAVPTPAAIPEMQRYLFGQTKVMKVDLVERVGLDAASRDRLVRMATSLASGSDFDAAIVSDFGLGLLTPAAARSLCEHLRPRVRVLTGGATGRRASLMDLRHLDLVTPSEDELRDAMRDHGDALPAVAWRLLKTIDAGAAVVTLGPDGLIAFEPTEDEREGEARVACEDAAIPRRAADATEASGRFRTRLTTQHVPSLTPHAVDRLGCDEALLAAATLSLATNATLAQAAYIGAAAASVQSRSLGNAAVEASSLRREIMRIEGARLAVGGDGTPVQRAGAEGVPGTVPTPVRLVGQAEPQHRVARAS